MWWLMIFQKSVIAIIKSSTDCSMYSGDVSWCVKDYVETYRFRVPFILFVTDDKGNYKALGNRQG